MKKLLIVLAAMFLCGNVNATAWRVCSKPEAKADFSSVKAAVESNLVFAGDTLYIEPGHREIQEVTINKKLHLIGPGYRFVENDINAMDINEAVFTRGVHLIRAYSSVQGCVFVGGLTLGPSTTCIGNCILNSGINLSGGENDEGDNVDAVEVIVENNLINVGLTNTAINSYYNASEGSVIENNIICGRINGYNYWGSPYSSVTFLNNTIIAEGNGTEPIVRSLQSCSVHNNIIINTSTGFSRTQNSNQTYDTTWYRDFVLDAPASNGNSVSNNVFSCAPVGEYLNSVFNVRVEDVLIWNNANSNEEKFKHKANGPAVGAGIGGATCGAYGAVSGNRPYTPAGIPQFRPYIYDASIDDTPSSNNTVNASFKIKVQQ